MDILEVELIDQWTVGYEDSWVINGCLVERYFVVPAEEWQFGDPLIHDSHVETCSTLLQVVDIEPDWQGAFWKILGNPLFQDIRIIHPIALEVTWLIVNEEALFENWILQFSGLWSCDFFTALNIAKSIDTRFALVAHGRRTATSLFLSRLYRFVSQQLEQVKTIRECNVDSTVPAIKLPSRGKSRPAMPSAMSAPADSNVYEAGLVTTSVDPGIPLIDAPLASVHVKLPGAAPPAAQTQRYEGPCRCKESREKLESRAAVTPVTVDDNENVPTTSDGVEKMDAQEPRRSVRVTTGGMRLFKSTLRGVLSHNDRAAPRRQ
ncbi:hypothetical protein FOMPIDRAFT_1050429 [Fomitopsis schrenkii]|uniref:Uncharacterized protein n=1 Tax=Fomitopsis schrenkii TaxID=2126942 RepID=S8FDP1_FOMSC|nr:hypothetical protein FOMPIDRAFT_1050429 [Fomitopsis schrenkii]